jgi:hypothetical protein
MEDDLQKKMKDDLKKNENGRKNGLVAHLGVYIVFTV